MSYSKSYKGILKYYNEVTTEEIRKYFNYLPLLLNQSEILYEVILAYLFLKIEQAQNRCLYGGIVKIHHANANFVGKIIDKQHLTRDGFQTLYKNVMGHPFPHKALEQIQNAERIRDKVIHGKDVSDDKLRIAIIACLKYAELVNDEMSSNRGAGFKPFGDMRGFKGRGESLDVRTTKWLMRGLGFAVKS